MPNNKLIKSCLSRFDSGAYKYPVYTIKLPERAGYMLAGWASSMFVRSYRRGITVAFSFCVRSAILSALIRSPYSRVSAAAAAYARTRPMHSLSA